MTNEYSMLYLFYPDRQLTNIELSLQVRNVAMNNRKQLLGGIDTENASSFLFHSTSRTY